MFVRIAASCLTLLGLLSGSAIAQTPRSLAVSPEAPTPTKDDVSPPLPNREKDPDPPPLPIFRVTDASKMIGPGPTVCAIPEPEPEPDTILSRFGVRAEYLLWRMRDTALRIPILVDRSSSQTLMGNQEVSFKLSSGIRLGGTLWLDPEQIFSVDVNGFVFGPESELLSARSDGTTSSSLARPFFLQGTGQPVTFPVSIPNQIAGGLQTSTSTRLAGSDAALTMRIIETSSLRFEVLGGFRYASLREDISVTQVSQVLTTDPNTIVSAGSFGSLSSGSTLSISDDVRVSNNFYGGQVGFRSTWRADSFYIAFTGKAGVGDNTEFVHISGDTVALPGNPVVQGQPSLLNAGGLTGLRVGQGLYSGPNNSGVFSRSRASFLGEANLVLGFDLTSRLHLFAGYSFFYWSRVLRAGNQLDQTISPSSPLVNLQSTTSAADRPSVLFKQSDFWGQGLNIGFAFEF
jgi:Putative beta barrel porin-7 (BBP7)